MAIAARLSKRVARLALYLGLGALHLLPARILSLVASSLADPRPLGRYAGWRFAIEESTPTMRVRLRRLLWEHFKARGINYAVRMKWFDGLKMDLVLGNDQSRCLYVGGSFEPNEFAFLANFLRPGMVVVDAGANEGFYSVFMSRRVGADGQVIAVEPSPREGRRLAHNLAINDIKNVRVVESGLAAKAGRAILHIADPEHNGQNTLGEFIYQGVTRSSDVEIALEPLDELVRRLTTRHLDLIKMDVEGSEMRLLLGAEKVLKEHAPVILFELLDNALRAQGSSAKQVTDFLIERDFKIFTFNALGSLTPLQRLEGASSNLVAVPTPRADEVLAASRA